MQKFIACLLLVMLLGMMPLLLFAQLNQSPQQSGSEVEALKKRVLQVEKQLQTVENVEKLDLQAKLAEANAKLANAEFGKFQRELRDSNDEWLGTWSERFLGIAAIFVAILLGISGIFWFWLRYRADRLIADEVEKSLNGFKEAVGQVQGMKDELGVLKREHAASMLEDFHYVSLDDEHDHPEQIKSLSEEDLLQVFKAERYLPRLRYEAAKVLTVRQSPRLVSPLLEFLNSVINSDIDHDSTIESFLPAFVDLLGHIHTQEAYQGLKKFLNRLLTEDPKHKDLFLTETVLSLAWVSIQLDIRDSVSILRRAMPHFQHPGQNNLSALVEYFDRLNEPTGIKEILIQHVTDGMSAVENKCLELLQKYDPEYVEDWRASKTTDNSNA